MAREQRTQMVIGARSTFLVVLMLILPFSVILLLAQKASAIPAFARKYETSCQTCHVSVPALTPFGEAFRLNGYRFPEGQDQAVTKSPPVSMGAEGYKKLWPQSVWPGEIPGLPPIALLMESAVEYDQETDVFTMAGMGSEVEVLAAGTLDEHLAFWGGFEFANEDGEVATELSRVNLMIRPLESPGLQFKVGSFEPGLLLTSNHRRLMDQKLWVLGQPSGDNPWAPEEYQQGVEAYGVVQHRILYDAGVVEGSGSVGDKTKDYYGRLAYKWGGLALDGVSSSAEEGSANPKPWSETSVAVSAFAYHGTSLLPAEEEPMPEDAFTVVGGDVVVTLLDLAAHAGYTDRKDDRLLLDDPDLTDAKVKSTFAELSWVAYPWLIPAGRFESTKVTDETTQRASFTLNGLVRANVKTFLASSWVKEPDGKFTNEGATLGVLVGF